MRLAALIEGPSDRPISLVICHSIMSCGSHLLSLRLGKERTDTPSAGLLAAPKGSLIVISPLSGSSISVFRQASQE